MAIVICDIDGTLAQVPASRINLLRSGKWDAFSAGTVADKPIRPVIRLIQMLYGRGYEIHLHTGRGEPCRAATEEWLWDQFIPFQRLLMRPEGDRTPDWQMKREWLVKGYNKTQVYCVFEDRTPNAEMYRQQGLLCFQVAANDGNDVQRTGAVRLARFVEAAPRIN